MVQPGTPIAVIRSNAVASCAAAIAHLGSAATYDGVGRPALPLKAVDVVAFRIRTWTVARPARWLRAGFARTASAAVEPGPSSIAITGDIDGLSDALGLS
jgi:hypothetical protein